MLILTIARLTVLEMLRRKLFLVLLGLTLLVVAFTSWGFGQITTVGTRPMTRVEQVAVVSQLLILVGFMFSFTLAFSAVFAGAPSLSGAISIHAGRAGNVRKTWCPPLMAPVSTVARMR